MTLRRLEPLLYPLLAVCVAASCALLAYRTEPLVPVVAFAVASAVALALARPIAGLYLSIALAPLELFALKVGASGGGSGEGLGLSPPEAMLIVTGGAWAVRRLADGKLPLVESPLNKPLVLLLLAVVPGLAFAEDPIIVAKVLVIWTFLFLVFQLVVDEADERTVRGLLLALAAAGAVVGLIATIRTGGGSELSLLYGGATAEGRAEGSFGHPNTLATFEGLTLPGALALALMGSGRTRTIAGAAFLLCLAGLTLSLSRGGLLAVAGALGVMALWQPFRRVVLVIAIVVVPVAISGASPLGDVRLVDTVTQRLTSVESSAQANPRIEIWSRTPGLIADHPVFGVGMGQFAEAAPEYGLVGTLQEGTFQHAHNILLTITAELGLVGLAALCWLIVTLAGVILRGYRRDDRETRGLALAIGAALFALFLQGLVDYTLRLNLIVATVVVLAGCAVVLAQQPARASWDEPDEDPALPPGARVPAYAAAASR